MRAILGVLPFFLLSACTTSPPAVRAQPSAPTPLDAGSASVAASPDARASAPGEPHAELVHFPGVRGELGGFLYKPPGEGPFPAILFNHGSEKLPGNKYGQAQLYVARGFVLFVPHRTGHGRSPGDYVMDVVEAAPSDKQAETLVRVLDAQVDDVASAATYLKQLPFVDREAMAMAGCSFGGIETLLASERDLGMRAAVEFSGAAQTWAGNPTLRDRMRAAARNARVPIYFLQAQNDYDTSPSLELSRVMDGAGKPHQLEIFPPHGTTAEEGHAFCGGGASPPWGEHVLAFLAKNGVAPRAAPPQK